MIIIIDEASAKLASFYYHDEIFKLQWRNVAGKASMSEELQEKLYVALPADESINDFQKTTIQEYADNTAKANTGNLRTENSRQLHLDSIKQAAEANS